MQSSAANPDQYFAELPVERKPTMNQLRSTIQKNIPSGFEEQMGFGMVGYVVPHAIYPAGYHCDPSIPLPFLAIASQKNFIAFYHMGIYADANLYHWFVNEFPKHSQFKLDMGKSCIRFKKLEHIPFDLLGELVTKISVQDWISTYEKNYKK